jgi:tyrosyl-tRNA synthetase
MIPEDIQQQVRTLMYGTEFGDPDLAAGMERDLVERLVTARKEGRPLRVYAGYDPSRPDLHIGHSITLRKLREFQDYGHDVYFLVGTFTATVGDASDKLTGRPRKSEEEVAEAASSYAEQCYRILDRERTEVVMNGDWLSKLSLADFVAIASNFTVQQFLARENFRRRVDGNEAIGLHEFFYALLQGWDAVHLRADVQLGATEQLFNIQAGRKLQEIYGQPPCICLTYPILVGTDGKQRMSKSTGNYVALTEEPSSQYGKVMSISDDTMLEWIRYVTRWTPDEIEQEIARIQSGSGDPMGLKKRLAFEIVSMYQGEEVAVEAQQHFESVHQRKQVPDDMPVVQLDGPAALVDVLTLSGAAKSKSEARRLIQGGGVRLDGVVVDDIAGEVEASCLLQVGKRRFYRVEIDG